MRISVTCSDGVAQIRLAAGMERLQANLAALHQQLGEELKKGITLGFKEEVSPEGTPWAPLKKSTVRQRKGDAHPILRVRGDLYRSIAVRSNADKAIVGTNWRYAAIHQFGGDSRRTAGVVTLRKYKSGPRKGRVRFARTSKYSFEAAAKAHVIRIPARPYLFQRDGNIPQVWIQALTAIVIREMHHAQSY